MHVGHLAAASAAKAQLGLDEVLLVVANHPWQKVPDRQITPAQDRLALVQAACAGLEGVSASSLEIDRGGPSYTIDTVEELQALAAGAGEPRPELYLIVGADLVATLPTWKRYQDLSRLVTLAVVPRPRTEEVSVPPGWRWSGVEGVQVDVSSSEIRRRLAAGQEVGGQLPAAVIRCIQRRGLYAKGR